VNTGGRLREGSIADAREKKLTFAEENFLKRKDGSMVGSETGGSQKNSDTNNSKKKTQQFLQH